MALQSLLKHQLVMLYVVAAHFLEQLDEVVLEKTINLCMLF